MINRQAKTRVEMRYYSLPQDECALAMMGKSWVRNYGNDVPTLHFHNLAEVGVCRDGHGYLLSDLGKTDYRGSTITYFPNNALHHTNTYGLERLDFWEYLFFDTQRIVMEHCKEDPVLGRMLISRLQYGVYVGNPEDSALPAILDSIFACMARPGGSLHQRQISDLIFVFLLELYSLLPDSPAFQGRTIAGGALGNALHYMEAHYTEDLRIGELAQICGFSETHFRRLFVQAVNMSPVDYLTMIRVQHACELLRISDEDMDSIAMKAGFGSLSSFNRGFVKFLGMPPNRWRREERRDRKDASLSISIRPGWT